MADSLTQVIVLAAAGFIVLVVLGWVWARRREVAAVAARRAAVRQLQTRRQREQRERAELARQIVATSSSATIAGFELVRQRINAGDREREIGIVLAGQSQPQGFQS